MSIAIGVWSQILTPGKEEVVSPPADVRITNVALGDQLVEPQGRTTVKLTYDTFASMDDDDEEEEVPLQTSTVLCSLIGGKIEQVTTDIILEEGADYTFTLLGKNAVYLTGNYIDQTSADRPPNGSEDGSDMDSEEDAFDLRDVSSDVEMNPEDIDGLESESESSEIHDVPQKTPKRSRESDVADFPSAKSEKIQNKKLKIDEGKSVPVAAESEKSKKEKKGKKGKGDKDEAGPKKDEAGVKKDEAAVKKDEAAVKKDEAGPKKADATGKKSGDGEQPKKTVVERELPGGIKVFDAKVGTGPMAKKGNVISMRYIGRIGKKVFDKNTKGKPFTFHLGRGEVIKGWDEGIAGMQVGGERKLTIPPELGYGKKGTDGIPGNSTLIFEVKLMEIKK